MVRPQTYYLVDPGRGMPRWCELAFDSDTGARIWIDFKARRMPYAAARPIAHVQGESQHATIDAVPEEVAQMERRLAFRHLLDPWSDQGWVSPDGRFYGCAYYEHDDIAQALLRKTPGMLEHLGWIRVHADSFRAGVTPERPTRRQADTLIGLGFADGEPGAERVRHHAPDRDLPPPRFAVRPPPGLQETPERVRAAPDPVSKPLAEALARLAERLASDEALAHIFAEAPEHVTDVGPGIWTWMLRFRDIDLGGEEHPEELVKAAGLHLRATSFDTIEVSEWPFEEIRIDPSATDLVSRRMPSPA